MVLVVRSGVVGVHDGSGEVLWGYIMVLVVRLGVVGMHDGTGGKVRGEELHWVTS